MRSKLKFKILFSLQQEDVETKGKLSKYLSKTSAFGQH